MPEKGLGKGPGAGLSALFGSNLLEETNDTITSLPVSKVEPRQEQPRNYFDEESLHALADSIKQHGLIQPITVRKLSSGYYQIIAGERRWRAARIAALQEIPARVIEADDRRAMELALVENLQREDLNPIEEARGYKTLIEEYGLTQEEASKSVGKSRPAIANALRLLDLTPAVLKYVEEGSISAGHARALLSIRNLVKQQDAANQILMHGLSVRQVEANAARINREEKQEATVAQEPSAEVDYIKEAERSLSNSLGRRVTINNRKKAGQISLEFYGQNDMNDLILELKKIN